MQPLPFFNLRPPPPLTVPHCHSRSEPAADGSPTPPRQRRPEMVGGRGRLSGRPQRTQFDRRRERVSTRPTSDGSGDENDDHTDDAPPWRLPSVQNRAFEEYYREQGIVSADEWDAFMEYLRKPLPATFRINSCRFCFDIRFQLESEFSNNLQAEFIDGNEVEAVRPLPWYPDNLAWQSNFCRKQLRKNPNLERFHEFLKLENEIGNITRQEAVSMVPPLLLDLSPEHFVLDMCAAPGSKTYQMLEIMNQSVNSRLLPEGLIVANDVGFKRSDVLIHKMKRMCTANLMVTNHEAQNFPGCLTSTSHSNASEKGSLSEWEISQTLFDRVLCDVPCSGDGTLRKAPNIWWRWKAGIANGLHGLQVQIAMRGISLLKVDGRMVYSTCSMNPVENEAVVAEILRRCGDSVELVDVSSELPQLVRRPGLRKWKVRDKFSWFCSFLDVPEARRGGVASSMFPSGKTHTDEAIGREFSDNKNSENGFWLVENRLTTDTEISDFPLERCMRIMPHDQNGGAFFIAVFRKLAASPAIHVEPTSSQGTLFTENTGKLKKFPYQVLQESLQLGVFPKSVLETDFTDGPDKSSLKSGHCNTCMEQNPPKIKASNDQEKAEDKRMFQNQSKWNGVDPIVFLKDEVVINSIRTFYGIDESFTLSGHLVTRNAESDLVKRIYYVSKSVKDLLELNFQIRQQLKITYVGQKMFERKKSKEDPSASCIFRISSEGLPILLPHITKQILHASPTDFGHLLLYKSRKFTNFVNVEFGKKASQLKPGCCVVVLNKDGESPFSDTWVDESLVAILCWKGKVCLNVMASDDDCQELLQRLRLCEGTGKESPLLVKKPSDNSDGDDEKKDLNMIEDIGYARIRTVC
ncbi:RNA cytosine-C(5)-methyltransferase NSUN2-like isoform X2 [Rhodamnia argentea]|uniref:RNA cytosine-C(5)-methyltransferase NSUN2-like isoform X2 n=1 Tax=Rhodamnia argentea TaxID=178133 RepID=A0ABM3GVD4_9MYRT|nr:RNA cytosine-C(5)-methyltransferase NSUN2-like isoform X2 [Rhodamnia argentea]